jgi:hypothetical protein
MRLGNELGSTLQETGLASRIPRLGGAQHGPDSALVMASSERVALPCPANRDIKGSHPWAGSMDHWKDQTSPPPTTTACLAFSFDLRMLRWCRLRPDAACVVPSCCKHATPGSSKGVTEPEYGAPWWCLGQWSLDVHASAVVAVIVWPREGLEDSLSLVDKGGCSFLPHVAFCEQDQYSSAGDLLGSSCVLRLQRFRRRLHVLFAERFKWLNLLPNSNGCSRVEDIADHSLADLQ